MSRRRHHPERAAVGLQRDRVLDHGEGRLLLLGHRGHRPSGGAAPERGVVGAQRHHAGQRGVGLPSGRRSERRHVRPQLAGEPRETSEKQKLTLCYTP